VCSRHEAASAASFNFSRPQSITSTQLLLAEDSAPEGMATERSRAFTDSQPPSMRNSGARDPACLVGSCERASFGPRSLLVSSVSVSHLLLRIWCLRRARACLMLGAALSAHRSLPRCPLILQCVLWRHVAKLTCADRFTKHAVRLCLRDISCSCAEVLCVTSCTCVTQPGAVTNHKQSRMTSCTSGWNLGGGSVYTLMSPQGAEFDATWKHQASAHADEGATAEIPTPIESRIMPDALAHVAAGASALAARLSAPDANPAAPSPPAGDASSGGARRGRGDATPRVSLPPRSPATRSPYLSPHARSPHLSPARSPTRSPNPSPLGFSYTNSADHLNRLDDATESGDDAWASASAGGTGLRRGHRGRHRDGDDDNDGSASIATTQSLRSRDLDRTATDASAARYTRRFMNRCTALCCGP
jgi:hypothetical protein